jgi:N-carbamoyl-L-amino-acid hydrolase
VVDGLLADVRRLVADDGLELELAEVLRVEPPRFDDGCNRAVEEAAARLGHPSLRLFSGAVHDAMYLARIAPATLVFVPCRDGISHHPAEYASPEHAAAGCDVLLHAALAYAGVATG